MQNWQKVLQKIENHINILSTRQLSFNGKAITKHTNETHKYIFTLIWQNKNQELIVRKTLFLKKEHGGLIINETEAHNLSMSLKDLLNFKKSEKELPLMYLATYWLAKDIYNYSKDFQYLENNNRAKTTNKEAPFYYKNLIHYVKKQNSTTPTLKNETKTIYKTILKKAPKTM